MALNDIGYAHITAHTNQVIDRFNDELQAKLKQDPSQAKFLRAVYHAYAAGALAVWMSAAAGLSHPADAATLAQKVRSFTEE